MLSETLEMISTNQSTQKSIVKISGYLRGRPLAINSLIHLVENGTFAVKSYEINNSDPFFNMKKGKNDNENIIIEVDSTK